jgi:hypothetical protein
MDDDVSIEELQRAVEHMHGVPDRFIEASRSTSGSTARLSGRAP